MVARATLSMLATVGRAGYGYVFSFLPYVQANTMVELSSSMARSASRSSSSYGSSSLKPKVCQHFARSSRCTQLLTTLHRFVIGAYG